MTTTSEPSEAEPATDESNAEVEPGAEGSEAESGESSESASALGSLKERVFSASFWLVLVSIGRNAIRFGSNLVLTRLLVPEAFGLMAVANSLMIGAEMLSDVGLNQSVVRSERAEDPVFLNTLWSLKLARGLGLAAVLLVLAYPASLWFDEPQLTGLVAIVGVSMAIRGASHVCEMTLTRQLKQRPVVTMEIVSQVAGVIASFGLAWWWREVWALALGLLFLEIVRTSYSFYLGRDQRLRFAIDKGIARSVRNFGRWIFLSSALTYLLAQGDRLVLGSLLGMERLGQYSIAINLAAMPSMLSGQLASGVLFPLYSLVGKSTDSHLLRRIRKVRLALMVPSLPPLVVLVVFGDVLVQFLWDSRYHEAGWMVRLLGIGCLLAETGNIGPMHWARGESWVGLVMELIRLVALLAGVIIGHSLWGVPGVIGGIAVGWAAEYPANVWSAVRYKVWLPDVDGIAFLASAVLIGLGELARGWFGLPTP